MRLSVDPSPPCAARVTAVTCDSAPHPRPQAGHPERDVRRAAGKWWECTRANGFCGWQLRPLASSGYLVRVPAHTEGVRRGRTTAKFLRSAAVWLLTAALSPLVVVVAGEPLRRYVLARQVSLSLWRRVPGIRGRRRAGRRPGKVLVAWRRRTFAMTLVSNPLWIALTAPARWLLDRTGGPGRRPWHRPPDAGVREPRRPRPTLPGGSVALAEPRTKPVVARLLGTISRRSDQPDEHVAPWRQRRGRG